jgi:hypothetical protein
MPCQHCCRLDDSTLNVSMYTSYRKIWSDTVISSKIKLVSQSMYLWGTFKSVLDTKPLAHTTGLCPLWYLLSTTRLERLVKLFACERLLSCVRALMYVQAATPTESLTTHITDNWCVPTVQMTILDTDLPKMSQRKTFHPVWDATWRSKAFLYVNVFPQVSYWFRFTSYCKSGWCMCLCWAKLFLYS